MTTGLFGHSGFSECHRLLSAFRVSSGLNQKAWPLRAVSAYLVMGVTYLPSPEYFVGPPESYFHGTPHRLPENGQPEGQEDSCSSCLLLTQVCSIVSPPFSQNTDSKITLLRGSRRQQQSIKPNTESFWPWVPCNRVGCTVMKLATEKLSSSALGKRN